MGIALGYGFGSLRDHERRLAQLEAAPKPAPASKHDAAALAQSNSAEAALFEAAKVVTQLTVAAAQVDNMMLKLEWIRDNGNPDAPWSQIVAWKNAKGTK